MKNPRPWLRYIEAGDDLMPVGGGPALPGDGHAGGEDVGEPLGESGIRALRAERAARAAAEAERDTYKAKHEEAERAKLSDLERAQTDAATAAQRAEAAEVRLRRFEVAADKGIPLTLAPRLNGTTREEIEADAASLIAALGSAIEPAKRAPAPDPSAGASGGGETLSIGERLAEMRSKKTAKTT